MSGETFSTAGLYRVNGAVFVSKSKKSINNIELIAKYADIFKCPICAAQMNIVNLKSLICSNNHCFDISRQGYINLFPHAVKTKYSKQMFQSRSIIFNSGFFQLLIEKISREIIKGIQHNSNLIKILDAGCGEGFHLSNIVKQISQSTKNNLLGVGVDISKEGIAIAAKKSSDNIWCVADIARCPFKSKQFDYVLNILSPSNYTEFQRVLTDDGIVIKVVPESGYLQELRQMFYARTDKEFYSNEKTVELFKNNLALLDIQHLRYTVTMDSTLIEHLLHMTPLSWGTTEEHLQKVLEKDLSEITVDLAILFGKKVFK